MNTPNKITIFRTLIIPFFIICLLINIIPYRFYLALIIFIVAAITDHLDGKIARKYNQITSFGKFLDPLADKMLIMSAFICFVELNLVGSVPVIIILFRDALVTAIRLVAANKGITIAANVFGKIKTLTQIIAIIIILILQCIESEIHSGTYNMLMVNRQISSFFVWVSVIFTVFSGVVYVKENFYIIKNLK